jgi:hypothetical protein
VEQPFEREVTEQPEGQQCGGADDQTESKQDFVIIPPAVRRPLKSEKPSGDIPEG